MKMEYTKVATLPAYETVTVDANGMPCPPRDPEAVRWSGKTVAAPPAIGERIMVRMNGLGPAKVVGYFTEAGYLGLLVKFENPPAWWVRQVHGKRDTVGHVFGAEIAPL